MNAFVRKEVRLLLPGFVMALGLAAIAFYFSRHSNLSIGWRSALTSLPNFIGPALMVMLALSSFGGEISGGTFSNLLAQPISRRRIWRTKTSLLAAAILILWSTWIFNMSRISPQDEDWNKDMIYSGLVALAVYSGGLWTVLLLRQIAAGFWFTILIPAILLTLTEGILENHPNAALYTTVAILLTYSVAGFLFARRLFLRAQDVQWTGGTIEMPEMRGLARWKMFSGTRRMWRPRMALLGKELQFHQAQYIIAGGLAVCHLGVLASSKWVEVKKNSDLELILQAFWVLWFIIPFLVGSAAVAEERKLGTLDAQLSLPVRPRTQFRIKLLVVVALSVLFGAVVPYLFEGGRILPNIQIRTFDEIRQTLGYGWNPGEHTDFMFLWFIADWINVWLPLVFIPICATAIGLLSFYVSSLSRNALQALGLAVLLISLSVPLLVGAAQPEYLFDFVPWHGSLIYLIGLPVMLTVLLSLSFRNSRRSSVGWNLWRRNFLVLALSLVTVMTATAAIYNRAWELVMRLEPPHAAPQIPLPGSTRVLLGLPVLVTHLQNDRVWLGNLNQEDALSDVSALVFNQPQALKLAGGFFLQGSNWVSTALDWRTRQLIAVRNDGTLWFSEKKIGVPTGTRGQWTIESTNMVRFGDETDWKIVSHLYFPILLKKDGTLWYWGTNRIELRTGHGSARDVWRPLQNSSPRRLGSDSDWADISGANYRKTDGSVWTAYNEWPEQYGKIDHLEPWMPVLKRVPFLETNRFIAVADIDYQYQVGVRDNGTFHLWASREYNQATASSYWSLMDRQIGAETNWLAVAGYGQKLVTLKRDGSLWFWNFNLRQSGYLDKTRQEQDIINTTPVRLSTHSDWVSLADFGGVFSEQSQGGVVALAADGGLWYWPFYSQRVDGARGIDIPRLLELSRKPQKVGNIFETK